MNWIIFVVVLVVLIYLLLTIIKKKKLKHIIVFAIVGIFFVYSFFTASGAVRLTIATMGHPIDAYSTGLDSVARGSNSMFLPTKDIQMASGRMLFIECDSYGPIKIAAYYGGG